MTHLLACSCGASEVERRSAAGHVVRRADFGLCLTSLGYLCPRCREYLARSPEVAHAADRGRA